jgi:hypothetical protein
MSSNEPCNCDQALALQKQVDELLELNNLRATAIKKQSRLLMDNEVIDRVDIVLGATGYKAVPEEWVGKRPLDIGPRRWWGHLTEMKKKAKQDGK